MSLMKDAGVEHLSEDASQKFQDRFRLDLSDEDAEHFFLELIHESLNAIAPVVLEKFHRVAVAFKYYSVGGAYMSCCVSETAKASRASRPSASLDTESKNHNARQKGYRRISGLLARQLKK